MDLKKILKLIYNLFLMERYHTLSAKETYNGKEILDPTDVLAVYQREVRLVSDVLTDEEQRSLAHRMRQGDEDAKNKLVESNLRFVLFMTKFFRNRGVPMEELIQAGNFGLLRATERFDDTRGFKFITYASRYVRNEMHLAVARERRTVRISHEMDVYSHKVKRAFRELENEGKNPLAYLDYVAERLGVDEDYVLDILAASSPERPLDKKISDDDDRELSELISDESQDLADQFLIDQDLKHTLYKALSGLEEREATVLRLFFGIGDEEPLNLQQIGAKFGLTRERARQIKEEALLKLRRRLNGLEQLI